MSANSYQFQDDPRDRDLASTIRVVFEAYEKGMLTIIKINRAAERRRAIALAVIPVALMAGYHYTFNVKNVQQNVNNQQSVPVSHQSPQEQVPSSTPRNRLFQTGIGTADGGDECLRQGSYGNAADHFRDAIDDFKNDIAIKKRLEQDHVPPLLRLSKTIRKLKQTKQAADMEFDRNDYIDAANTYEELSTVCKKRAKYGNSRADITYEMKKLKAAFSFSDAR